MEAVAVAFSMAWIGDGGEGLPEARQVLAGFRDELYRCLTARADALFELEDAVLCKQDRVHMLAELSLEPEHQRGHGALYDAVNCGRVEVVRLRRALAFLPLPSWPDGRIRLAADVSNWLRPEAVTSPQRLSCHCYARGKGQAQLIPGWPYSFVAVLEPGRTSWMLPLDAVRLGPVGFKNSATGHEQGFRRLVQGIASYWFIRPPSTGARLIRRAGNGMTVRSSAGARRFRARWALPML
jgi:DDE superfamily endonuclease